MKTYKQVVSNSSPLMNLAIIGQLDLVQKLFGNVSVPDEVWHELTVAGHGKPGAETLLKTDWIEVVPLTNRTLFTSLQKDLDDGEAAAITLAIENKADLLLLDETDARNIAEMYALPKTGIIGILTRAKNYQLIPKVKPLLDALKTQANFWIHPKLYEKILLQMGEAP